MNGFELKTAMSRIGITCRNLAYLCGWVSDSRIVEARSRGYRDIPIVIEVAMEKLISPKRYAALLDTLQTVPYAKIAKAKPNVIVAGGLEINRTYLWQLQIVAARYDARIEVYPVDQPTVASAVEESDKEV